MKKYLGIISYVVIGFATIAFVSCDKQIASSNVTLRNNIDSLSYIAGINEAKRNIPEGAFEQIGIQGFEEEFLKGVSDGIKIKESDKKAKAHIIGMQFGYGMASQMMPSLNSHVFGTDSTKSVNLDLFAAGLASVIQKKEIPANLNDSTFNALVEQIKAEVYKDAIAKNTKFLEDNKTKEGVVALPSGLQYKVITEGTGPKPTVTDRVKVHYHGTTIDGKVFDSSVDRGEPAEFTLDRVIKGWTEGLQLMPVGSKYTFYIPYTLGYGPSGNGQNIDPYSTLIFDVELLDIVPQDQNANMPIPGQRMR